MRFAIARFIVAVLALVLLVESAHAQAMGGGSGGGGRKQHQQKADKTDAQKPKVDDKAYNAALKSLPVRSLARRALNVGRVRQG